MKIHRYSIGRTSGKCIFSSARSRVYPHRSWRQGPFSTGRDTPEKSKTRWYGSNSWALRSRYGSRGDQLSYNIPLYIHEKDKFLLNRLEETARHFLGYTPIIIPIRNTTFLTFKFENYLEIGPPTGGWKLKIIHTPGHTPGYLYYC